MIYQTETKPQLWRAVAVFEDRPDQLIYLNRSNTQVVAATAPPTWNCSMKRNASMSAPCRCSAGKRPDSGRWVHQANLIVPNQERVVPIVLEQQIVEVLAA